jgi:nucleoside-diphosphate-sugar epimerase
MRRILVTGGAGFIGSNFIRCVLREHRDWEVTNLDNLTYAGNLENLTDVGKNKRYLFIKGDIADREAVDKLLDHGFHAVSSRRNSPLQYTQRVYLDCCFVLSIPGMKMGWVMIIKKHRYNYTIETTYLRHLYTHYTSK